MKAAHSERKPATQIRTRMFVSLDGYVTTRDGLPVQLLLPDFDPGSSHGLPEFLAECGAAVTGRTTFLPALGAPRWPWPDLRVFVLTSESLPPGTPAEVVTSKGGPTGLLEQMGTAGIDGDVHLVGGPQTVRAFTDIEALDRLELVVTPLMLGGGLPLSVPAADPLLFELLAGGQAYPDGTVELIYVPSAV
jgi:dihydrofolate reductase